MNDGIHGLLPRGQMVEPARKLRDCYARRPDSPLIQREFGFYSLDAWRVQGMPSDRSLTDLFSYDEPGIRYLGELGWCEPAFYPLFEEKVIEARGEHEVVQDFAGRHLLCFKGRRQGFMPEYLEHPVKDQKTWEENCKWRMDPNTPERYTDLEARMKLAMAQTQTGMMIGQKVVGGYMYLRSLIGPEDLLYMFYDNPDLIHDCMEAWLALADAVIAKHQQYVTLDELFLAEDICYNHGPLISPDMIKRFLFPYYQQLIANIRSRQLDPDRHLYIQIDTDGFANPVIPLYREVGMDVMSPFEVAAGCDVVQIGEQYPELVILGGIDKRVLAQGKAAIDAHLDYILPPMKKRGGFIPTCDHGVPEEVSLENYMYYRKRCLEFAQ